ncbi:hypothetical protein VRY85_05695 [Achromobacter sp. F4_2707]|uniref:hypothetical protein n=1 Tax=Achromobacter sp. F4_2707 TaxID=3114286 RepID=UPI0039C67A42
MKIRIALYAATIFSLSTSVSANEASYQIRVNMDALSQDFVQAPPYAAVNVDALAGDAYYASPIFSNTGAPQAAISLPDADLDPLTRAMLLVEAHEAALPHVRYHVTYSMSVAPDYPELLTHLVQVTRYNLGPAKRAALKNHLPENELAAPEEFGIGPHVSWRFVLSPTMGMQSALEYAGRAELADSQAESADCLGTPCLSLHTPQGPSLAWQPVTPPQLGAATYTPLGQWGVVRPARVMQELWAAMTSEGMDPLPYDPARPAFQFVMSLEADGIEPVVTGLAQQAIVMDSTVSEVWTRRVQTGPQPPEYAQSYVARR